TSPDGTAQNFGSTTLDPGKAVSAFLDQDPFNLPAAATGTFSFSASEPVAASAFRANTATSSQLLLANIPITDIDAPLNNQPITVPEFTDGGGWTTQILLVNPTEEGMGGELRFFKGGEPGVVGHPVAVNLNEGELSVVEYFVAPRSSTIFQTTGLTETLN